MPNPNPFPAQSDVEEFYGPHGVPNGFTPPTKVIQLPFTVYYDGQPVNSLRPHKKCADSLLRVFRHLHEEFPSVESKTQAGILVYNGLYNPRRMRGSTSAWSMHAWAIAIDLNAGRNGNTTHWPTQASMPLEVMECFAREGWLSAGAFWSRDAMHFQATR
ncbi:MAG: M15 family metallopeptidase [Fimbriimonas sp.]